MAQEVSEQPLCPTLPLPKTNDDASVSHSTTLTPPSSSIPSTQNMDIQWEPTKKRKKRPQRPRTRAFCQRYGPEHVILHPDHHDTVCVWVTPNKYIHMDHRRYVRYWSFEGERSRLYIASRPSRMNYPLEGADKGRKIWSEFGEMPQLSGTWPWRGTVS